MLHKQTALLFQPVCLLTVSMLYQRGCRSQVHAALEVVLLMQLQCFPALHEVICLGRCT